MTIKENIDDVIEAASLDALNALPETEKVTGKIYIALDTNKTYRWSGSTFVYITSGAVDSVNGKTGIVSLSTTDIPEGSNLYFTTGRVLETTLTGYSEGVNTFLVPSDNILVAFEKLQTQLNHKQAIGNYQPLDDDLTSISNLSGTSGFLRKIDTNNWVLDTSEYSLSTHNHERKLFSFIKYLK